MKRILAAAALIALLGFKGPYTLTVASYNVGVFSKYLPDSTPQVAAMMREAHADVVGLCEIDSMNLRHPGVDQLRGFLGEMGSGWDGQFGCALKFGGGGYGVGSAVSPRFKILDRYTINLPKGDGSEPRAAAVVETDRFVFATTHLDFTRGTARLDQARMLSDSLARRYEHEKKAVILCGDFNAAPDSETLDLMRERWDIVSPADLSYPSTEPEVCIDYIMILRGSANYKIIGRAGTRTKFKFGDPKTASDHLPTIVRLRLHQ